MIKSLFWGGTRLPIWNGGNNGSNNNNNSKMRFRPRTPIKVRILNSPPLFHLWKLGIHTFSLLLLYCCFLLWDLLSIQFQTLDKLLLGGRLRLCFQFWRKVCSFNWVLDVVSCGYRMSFKFALIHAFGLKILLAKESIAPLDPVKDSLCFLIFASLWAQMYA